MSVARTVTEVIRQHVTLEVESIDRMYLNVYQPKLQSERGVASFLRFHRSHAFASSALMDPISHVGWAEYAKPNIEPLPDNVGVTFVHPNIHFIEH